MTRISIVIPIYNSAQYLKKCLDSLIKQISEDDEILLIDDGSTDDSKSICSGYMSTHKNIRYFNTKYHAGPSATRNLGISQVQGNYIIFIDADDYVEENYIKVLMNNIEKYDFKIAGYRFINELKKTSTNIIYSDAKEEEIEKDNIIELSNKMLLNTLWNKIYKSKIIKENDIQFCESVTRGEDLLFNLDYIKYVKTKICMQNEPIYVYTMRKNGINASFQEDIDFKLNRANMVHKKLIEICSEKKYNMIVQNTLHAYFCHFKKYIKENKIIKLLKSIKIIKQYSTREELKEIISSIDIKDDSMARIKKLYFEKKFIKMYLENEKLLKRTLYRRIECNEKNRNSNIS